MTFPRRYKLSLRALVAIVITALLLASPNAFAQPQTWKINLSNADIKKFIEEVASITGKTFVVDPRVKGNVTVISTTSLDKEGVYELFLSVLRVHGFGASPTGNVIRIVQSTIVKQSGGA
ncbi:MAG: type II secretion system protein GspD, partial [Gammaproteobacteria bacterium]|nr:type II secretion system protein GspD [Gammaproteobacteria bacterium]